MRQAQERQIADLERGDRSDELEPGAHLDAALEAAGDGARARVNTVYPLGVAAPIRGERASGSGP